MSRLRSTFERYYSDLRRDIYKFCQALNFTPNRHQIMLFNAVMEAQYDKGPRQIAVKSGQGTGKTAASVVIALWRCLRAGDPQDLGEERTATKTALTAPTMRQCRDVWLAECRLVLDRADPILQRCIEVTKSKVEFFRTPGWGVTPVTANKPENAQGIHGRGLTILGEESSGIPRPIMEQFKGTMTNPDPLFVLIGNPNYRDCAFFDCFHSQRHNWRCLTFNAEETPSSDWFDPARNTRIAEEFGIDSDAYRVRVKGEFPEVDPNCLLSTDQVEACWDKALFLPSQRASKIKQFGIDFARFGGDECVIYRRSGQAIVESWRQSRVDPSVAVSRAFRMQVETEWQDSQCAYVVDAGGMGQGLVSQFYQAKKYVMEFNFGGTAMRSSEFANKITEAYFHLAKLIRNKECYIPRDDTLVQQVALRQYSINRSDGKLILESKDDYMKRGFDSPDRADALAMCFYPFQENPGRVSSSSQQGKESAPGRTSGPGARLLVGRGS